MPTTSKKTKKPKGSARSLRTARVAIIRDTKPGAGKILPAATGANDQRERILDAARHLIQEQSTMQFSMRAVAARARVSLATTYEIFESRGGLIQAIHFEERDRYSRLLREIKPTDELEALFHAVKTISDLCANGRIERAFFKELKQWPDHATVGMFKKAAKAGFIRKEINADIFAAHATFGYLHILHEWAIGAFDFDELYTRLAYSLAIALSGVTTPAKEPWLRNRILELQTHLARRQATE